MTTTNSRTAYNNLSETSETFPFLELDFSQVPAPAYIRLDLRDGEITADTGVSGSCSSDEFNNLVVRFKIDPFSTFDLINDFINNNLKSFQAVLDITDCDWSNGNYCGMLIGEKSWYDDVEATIEAPAADYLSMTTDEDFIEDFDRSDLKSGEEYFEALDNVIGNEVIIDSSYDEEKIISVINEWIANQ